MPSPSVVLRREPERAQARGIGDEGPHLTGAELTGHQRRDRLAEAIREQSSQIADGRGLTGADVEDLAIGPGIGGDEEVRPRHVLDEDQVA